MEHLSAEERACLMYLEETIEALEVQEDSGLSNDEAEPVSVEEKLRQIRVEGRHVFHVFTQCTSQYLQLCLNGNFFHPQMLPVLCLNPQRATQKATLHVKLKAEPQNRTFSSMPQLHTLKCYAC